MTVQSAAPSSFHASASMPSHISCPCILYRDGLYLVVSRCISLYLVVSRCISFSRCVSLHLALSCVQSAVGRRARRFMSRSLFRQAASCLLPSYMLILPCKCFHATTHLLPLYLVVSGRLYLVVSLCSCISIYPSEHLALSCSARTGALNLSAHHGHITGSITGVAHGSHTSLIPDVVVGFVGSPS